MYAEDQSVYKNEYYSLPSIRFIGWLNPNGTYPKGTVPAGFVNRLIEMASRWSSDFDLHVNEIRGNPPCELCRQQIEIPATDGSKIPLNMSELWVPRDSSNGWFACPMLIIHYIKDHQYRPPEEFIDAIQSLDLNQKINSQAECDKIVYAVTKKIVEETNGNPPWRI